MTIRNAICLVVDGLRASALGAYGNTWYPTPALDQLAARSLVADWLWVDSPEMEQFYRGVWQQVSAFRPVLPSTSVPLPKMLADARIEQSLITDDLWLDGHAANLVEDKSRFDSYWLDHSAKSSARAIEETAMGRLFASAIGQLDTWSSAQEPVAASSEPTAGKMLWVHASGMHGPWDAPYGLRESLVDEDEPAPPTFVSPPQQESGDDPDEWLGIRIAYAAQTIVLDACIGAMVAELEETGLIENTLLMLVGSRGFSLGEHGTAGTECRRLFSEQLHVPWLVSIPHMTGPIARFQGLSQPADIGATLLDWFGCLPVCRQPPTGADCEGRSLLPASQSILTDWRQFVVAQSTDGERAIRTPAWMLRQPDHEQANPSELYTKPDDRWEFNDIAVRCPQIVEELDKVLGLVRKQ